MATIVAMGNSIEIGSRDHGLPVGPPSVGYVNAHLKSFGSRYRVSAIGSGPLAAGRLAWPACVVNNPSCLSEAFRLQWPDLASEGYNNVIDTTNGRDVGLRWVE